MKRLPLALAAVWLTLTLPVATQASRQTTATLDFLVRADDGSAPAALAPSDLSLKIGGRPQQIKSVDLITAKSPRHIALIVDEATFYNLEPIVKDAVAQLLKSLGPGDMVGYFSTRLNGTRTNLTTQHAKITAALGTMKTGPGVLFPCQRDLMNLIATYAGDLPRGRSTSIAVLSRGHPEGPSMSGDSNAAPCTPRRDDLRALEEAISMAQVNLHFFTVSATARSWGFDSIAGNTGGTSELLTWSNHDALTRAIESTGTYYRLTFDWNVPNDRMQRVALRAPGKDLKIKTSSWLRRK